MFAERMNEHLQSKSSAPYKSTGQGRETGERAPQILAGNGRLGYSPSLSYSPSAITACQRAKQASEAVSFTPHSTHTTLISKMRGTACQIPQAALDRKRGHSSAPCNISFRSPWSEETSGCALQSRAERGAALTSMQPLGVSGFWVSFIA